MDREERIRQRAYEIWQSEGSPEGQDGAHWERASREIDAELAGEGPDVGGVSSGLQPSGTTPGSTPGASVGSIGTGGGSTAGDASGTVEKRD